METVAAILLAAGESRRMGSPKPLLPWEGTTLVVYQVRQLLLAGAVPLVVILGHEAERVAAALREFPEVRLVLNPAYREGKVTSLRAGVEALPEGVHDIVILSVDQPRRAATLRRLIEAHLKAGSLITVPVHGGRRGHPPILSAALRCELSAVTEERQGLREVMRRHLADTRQILEETPEVLLDINSPEEYWRAVRGAG